MKQITVSPFVCLQVLDLHNILPMFANNWEVIKHFNNQQSKEVVVGEQLLEKSVQLPRHKRSLVSLYLALGLVWVSVQRLLERQHPPEGK